MKTNYTTLHISNDDFKLILKALHTEKNNRIKLDYLQFKDVERLEKILSKSIKPNKMTNQQAFEKLISLYDICDQLQDMNEEQTAEEMRDTLNKLSAFIQSLNNQ
jgi:hypothetical protein